jgi:hypothetical protein
MPEAVRADSLEPYMVVGGRVIVVSTGSEEATLDILENE